MPSLKYDIIVDGNQSRIALQQFANETDAAFKKSERAVSRISLAALPEHEQAVVKVHRKYQALEAQINQLEKSGRISSTMAAGWHQAVGVQMTGDLQKLEKQGASTFSVLASSGKMFVAGLASVGLYQITSAIGDIATITTKFQGMETALKTVTGSQEAMRNEMVYLRSEAKRLGLDLIPLVDDYTKLAAAAKGSALEGANTHKIFSAVAQASRVLNLSSDTTSGVLLSISQMMSKGKVQAEELRGQLGERLPGAFQLAAKAMGVTDAELNKMLETGQVLAVDMLPKLADELNKVYGSGVEEAAGNAAASFARMRTAMVELENSIGNSGLIDFLAAAAEGAARFVDNLSGKSNLNGMLKMVDQVDAVGVAISTLDVKIKKTNIMDIMGNTHGAAGFSSGGSALPSYLLDGGAYDKLSTAKSGMVTVTQKSEAALAAERKELEKQEKELIKQEKAIVRLDNAIASYFKTIDEQVGKNRDVSISNALTDYFTEIDQFLPTLEKQREALEDINEGALTEHAGKIYDITAKYRDLDKQLTDLVSSGALSFEDATKLDLGLSANWQAEMDGIENITFDTTKSVSEFWNEAQRNMQSTSKTFFFDLMKGNFDDLGSQFEDMILNMVANWEAAQLQMALWGNDSSAGGGLGNGLIAAVVNAISPWTTQNAGVDAALTDFYSFHDGGRVGVDGLPGVASESLWNNAPRFHSGLASDEFPAILQKGETVIPAGGSAAGSGAQNYYITIVAADSQSFTDMVKRNPQAVIAPFREALQKGDKGLRADIQRASQ